MFDVPKEKLGTYFVLRTFFATLKCKSKPYKIHDYRLLKSCCDEYIHSDGCNTVKN